MVIKGIIGAVHILGHSVHPRTVVHSIFLIDRRLQGQEAPFFMGAAKILYIYLY